jgi:hypothetical protein
MAPVLVLLAVVIHACAPGGTKTYSMTALGGCCCWRVHDDRAPGAAHRRSPHRPGCDSRFPVPVQLAVALGALRRRRRRVGHLLRPGSAVRRSGVPRGAAGGRAQRASHSACARSSPAGSCRSPRCRRRIRRSVTYAPFWNPTGNQPTGTVTRTDRTRFPSMHGRLPSLHTAQPVQGVRNDAEDHRHNMQSRTSGRCGLRRSPRSVALDEARPEAGLPPVTAATRGCSDGDHAAEDRSVWLTNTVSSPRTRPPWYWPRRLCSGGW